MPRFEAGDHIGKAAMNTQISGQLPQPSSGLLPIVGNLPVRSRSRRGGRFHVHGIVQGARCANTQSSINSRLSN